MDLLLEVLTLKGFEEKDGMMKVELAFILTHLRKQFEKNLELVNQVGVEHRQKAYQKQNLVKTTHW